jgi:7-cyano-7-deazaguanine synthase
MNTLNKAVVLSSGGLDSTTTMAIAKNQGYTIFSLSFDYGQRHRFELEAARKVSDHLGAARHLIIPLDLTVIGGSALTADIPVPKGRGSEAMARGIPITYVPARNTIFLAMALAWAEVIQAGHIFIGVNAVDYSGYPDCRPEYITAFESMANLATRAAVEGTLPVRLHAPLIKMSKAQIIRTGIDLGVDFSLTHSCYDPSPEGVACGQCDSCILRRKGFLEAGVSDPTLYV